MLIVEVAIIAVQAGRGTTSHFNTATVFDAILFSIMGFGIVTQTITSVAVAVALWRQPFSNRVLRPESVRLGLISVAAGGYVLLIVLLLWQALRGQAVLQPDTSSLVAAIAWLTLVTGGALTRIFLPRRAYMGVRRIVIFRHSSGAPRTDTSRL